MAYTSLRTQGRAPGTEAVLGSNGHRSPEEQVSALWLSLPPRPTPLNFLPPLQAISKGQSLYHNIAPFTLDSFPLYEKAPSQAELTQRKCFWWPLARDLPIQGSPFPGVPTGP